MTWVFPGWMPFLLYGQQHQSIEGNSTLKHWPQPGKITNWPNPLLIHQLTPEGRWCQALFTPVVQCQYQALTTNPSLFLPGLLSVNKNCDCVSSRGRSLHRAGCCCKTVCLLRRPRVAAGQTSCSFAIEEFFSLNRSSSSVRNLWTRDAAASPARATSSSAALRLTCELSSLKVA